MMEMRSWWLGTSRPGSSWTGILFTFLTKNNTRNTLNLLSTAATRITLWGCYTTSPKWWRSSVGPPTCWTCTWSIVDPDSAIMKISPTPTTSTAPWPCWMVTRSSSPRLVDSMFPRDRLWLMKRVKFVFGSIKISVKIRLKISPQTIITASLTMNSLKWLMISWRWCLITQMKLKAPKLIFGIFTKEKRTTWMDRLDSKKLRISSSSMPESTMFKFLKFSNQFMKSIKVMKAEVEKMTFYLKIS